MNQFEIHIDRFEAQVEAAKAFYRLFPNAPFSSMPYLFIHASAPTINLDPSRFAEVVRMFGRDKWSADRRCVTHTAFKYRNGVKLMLTDLKPEAWEVLFPQLKTAGGAN